MVGVNLYTLKAYFLMKGIFMYILNRKHQLFTSCVIVVLLTSCSGMSTRDKNTAIGAGVGAVGGAVLTGGGVLGTVGGAAVGGVIGNQVGKDKKK